MNKKGLKQKDIDRIDELQLKFPGDVTEDEKQELEKLVDRYAQYGRYKE